MNVVDSSGWLEYFGEGPNADAFQPAILDIDELVVPTIILFEVFKAMLSRRGENEALRSATLMRRGVVVELNAFLAAEAARVSLELKLPMADAIILATSRALDATLWTQDSDFEGTEGVRYIARQ